MARLRVGVLYGGRSGEHEVSLQSARSVMEAMDREKYEVLPFLISKEGSWFYQEKEPVLLSLAPDQAGFIRPGKNNAAIPVDVVFPVLHGPYGEDGTVQGLLEVAGLPYVGTGVLASAAGMDKEIMKILFAKAGLPQVRYLVVKRDNWEGSPGQEIKRVTAELGFPCFVKPANLGSSVGISKVVAGEQLAAALDLAARYDAKIIVEEGLEDIREIEVSVLGNDRPEASVPGEIIPSNEFYDYRAKYIDGQSALVIPAPLSKELADRVRAMAVSAFQAIEGSGLSRVDFLLTKATGQVYLNEINTLPGFTSISMYPKLWEATGLPYGRLIDRLLELALERFQDRKRNAVS